MKKLAKIITCAVVAAACVVSAAAFAACGDASVAGTYTYKNTDKSDFGPNTFNTGFITAGAQDGAYLEDTLVLNDDGTYVLTKKVDLNCVAYFEEMGATGLDDVVLTYTYYGEYTNDGSTVTLKACTKVDYDEQWSMFATTGYLQSTSGTATSINDVTVNYSVCPFKTFYSEYLNETTNGWSDQQVTVSGSSVTFIAAANSDDD